MIRFKIVVQNLLKHKGLSSVLLIIFTSSVFVVYWIFGFSNYFSSYIYKNARSLNGDITAATEFTEEDKIVSALSDVKAEHICHTVSIYVMADSPKQSGLIWLNELAPDVMERRRDYYRPVSGRMPEKPDEIMLSDYDFKTNLKVGDTLYITTTTPQRVVNAVKYTVAGINKSGGNLVTQKGMEQLLNSKSCNRIICFISKEKASKIEIEGLGKDLNYKLARNYILVHNMTDIFDMTDPYKPLIDVFTVLKTFLTFLLMPLVGIVIAVIVYMYAYKRRKEIWTYAALGMRDQRIRNLIISEYMLISVIGTILGLLAGFFTDFLSELGNIFLDLGDLMYMPLRSKITPADCLIIIVFVLLTVYLSSYRPVNMIARQKPFGY